MSKYHNRKTEYNGHNFDSKLEAEVAKTLDYLMRSPDNYACVLSYVMQVPFELIPAVKDKKLRSVMYIADFDVCFGPVLDLRRKIIEVKGFETPVWKLKRRLFQHLYPNVDLRVVKDPAELIDIANEGRSIG